MKTEKSNKSLWIASIVFIAATFIYIGVQYRKIEKHYNHAVAFTLLSE